MSDYEKLKVENEILKEKVKQLENKSLEQKVKQLESKISKAVKYAEVYLTTKEEKCIKKILK